MTLEVGKILVAVGDTYINTVEQTTKHGVAAVVGDVVELWDTIVTPSADRLVGGEGVGIEQLAHETSGTAVKSGDVGISIGAAITGNGHIGIALVEYCLSSNGLGIVLVGVQRGHIQVISAGAKSQSQQHGCGGKDMLEIFHCFDSLSKLEIQVQTEDERDWARVYAIVDTTVYLRVYAVVVGDAEHVAYGAVDAAADALI